MRPGDVIESAVWITGDESPQIRAQYEADVRQAIGDLCTQHQVAHGPITFREKHPFDDGVPEVPDHIQGSRVRLLVAEAVVDYPSVLSSEGSFIANLDKKDLIKLRLITKKAWAKHHQNEMLTDKQCDDYIEQCGPQAALETLRSQHNTLQ